MEDKYKSYTGPELAGDDAFIRWVVKGENHQSWSGWQSNNPDKSDTVKSAIQLVKALNALPVDVIHEKDKHDLWNKIQTSIPQETPSYRVISFVKWSLAAAAALALMIWVNSVRNIEKTMVADGERMEINLPESSKVFINADSKVVYNKAKFNNDREVTLKGEAFFEVRPGSRFTVNTDQGSVTVLGTSFNVIARPGRFEVSCHTGKVLVTNNKKESVELTPGEKASEGDQMKESTFTPTALPPWTEGKFMFDNQPLSIVLEELERQYDVNVSMQRDISEIRYTGFFEAGDLSEALLTVTWPLRLKYEVKGKSVTVSR